MKPLSLKRRRLYLLLCAVAFLAFVPLFTLYATGYRFTFGNIWGIIRTGGVFVSVPETGAQAYLDGTLVRSTGFFQRNVFIQNLKPGSYEVSIEKEGFQPWKKNLTVIPTTVAEAHAFLLSEEPLFTDIPRFLPARQAASIATGTPAQSVSSSSRGVENPSYREARLLFSTTTPERSGKKLTLRMDGKTIIVSWGGSLTSAPYYFCARGTCTDEVALTLNSASLDARFFPGRDDILIVRTARGIYALDLDPRPPRNVQTFLEGKNLYFRIEDGILYVKQGSAYSFLPL